MIRVRGLTKRFKDSVAVDRFSLEIGPAEFVSLLGPSGCGKTTTLRCIAGLEQPDEGQIEILGQRVFDRQTGIALPPERRNLSMVFQSYALWPHMSVFENVAYALQLRRVPADQTARAVETALNLVRLGHMGDRLISQLSGGEQQRVALARSVAFHPQVVLFDEPLSNLDAKLREEMRIEIVELQRKLGFAALYVTHDQDEAMSLSNRIVVMKKGKIEQTGPPKEVYFRPATPFVAQFIGSSNRLAGTVVALGESGGPMRIRTNLDVEFLAPQSTDNSGLQAGDPVEIYVRYVDLLVAGPDVAQSANVWRSQVLLESFLGSASLLKLRLGGGEVMALVAQPNNIREGEELLVQIPPDRILVYRPA